MGTLRLQHLDALNVSPRLGDLSVAAGRGRLKWEQRLEKAGGARPGGRAAGERALQFRVKAQNRTRCSEGPLAWRLEEADSNGWCLGER